MHTATVYIWQTVAPEVGGKKYPTTLSGSGLTWAGGGIGASGGTRNTSVIGATDVLSFHNKLIAPYAWCQFGATTLDLSRGKVLLSITQVNNTNFVNHLRPMLREGGNWYVSTYATALVYTSAQQYEIDIAGLQWEQISASLGAQLDNGLTESIAGMTTSGLASATLTAVNGGGFFLDPNNITTWLNNPEFQLGAISWEEGAALSGNDVADVTGSDATALDAARAPELFIDMLSLEAEITSGVQVAIVGCTVTLTGTAPNADGVSSVSLWLDSNGDGLGGDGGALIGAANFALTGGAYRAWIPFAPVQTVEQGAPKHYVVTAVFNNSAVGAGSYGVSIATSADYYVSTAGGVNDSVSLKGATGSGLITISGALPVPSPNSSIADETWPTATITTPILSLGQEFSWSASAATNFPFSGDLLWAVKTNKNASGYGFLAFQGGWALAHNAQSGGSARFDHTFAQPVDLGTVGAIQLQATCVMNTDTTTNPQIEFDLMGDAPNQYQWVFNPTPASPATTLRSRIANVWQKTYGAPETLLALGGVPSTYTVTLTLAKESYRYTKAKIEVDNVGAPGVELSRVVVIDGFVSLPIATLTVIMNEGALDLVDNISVKIARPTCDLSGTDINFGTIGDGVVTTRSVTVVNNGSGALAISDISSAAPGVFALVGATTRTITEGSSDTLTFQMLSPLTGDYSSTFTLHCNDTTGLYNLLLSGTVATSTPVCLVTPTPPSPLNFGQVDKATSKTLAFQIENGGLADLNVSSMTVATTDTGVFTVLTPFPLIALSYGSTALVQVRFLPTQDKAYDETWKILSNDPAAERTVRFQGLTPGTEVPAASAVETWTGY